MDQKCVNQKCQFLGQTLVSYSSGKEHNSIEIFVSRTGYTMAKTLCSGCSSACTSTSANGTGTAPVSL